MRLSPWELTLAKLKVHHPQSQVQCAGCGWNPFAASITITEMFIDKERKTVALCPGCAKQQRGT